MDCYNHLYYKLFNGITDAIEDLQTLQKQAEEDYLKSEEQLSLLNKNTEQETAVQTKANARA